jgi:hypothetical protein
MLPEEDFNQASEAMLVEQTEQLGRCHCGYLEGLHSSEVEGGGLTTWPASLT